MFHLPHDRRSKLSTQKKVSQSLYTITQKLGTEKTSKKTRLKHVWTTLSKWLVPLAWRIYMKSTISASHVMEYTTNDNLLTIHAKYLHSIFYIAPTSQIGKLNFSVNNTLQ